MEQLRQIGEALGSIKALMAFQDEIRINKRQCCLLVDALNLAFEVVTEEISQNLCFDERVTRWRPLEHPLWELHRICRDAEQYVRQCVEAREYWWVRALSLGRSADCVELHLHDLLWCVPVVLEAVEAAAELSGCDPDDTHRKRVAFSKRYDKEWLDPDLFQHQFGRSHLVTHGLCSRMDAAGREDRWALLDMISNKKRSATRHEALLADLLKGSREKLFPSSIMVASKDYQVRRRLGRGSHYKEVQWMGEGFAVRHFFGDIEPLVPEILRLSSLSHPNVVPFHCAFSDEDRKECFLLMELMQKSLCTHVKEACGSRRRVPFPLPVAVDAMLQVARGMEYLHSRGVTHGNLNPSTILVRTRSSSSHDVPQQQQHLLVKVAGFGLSSVRNYKYKSPSTDQTAGTNPCIWVAPEALQEEQEQQGGGGWKPTEKADVYSFGMVCFELLTGKVPFEDGHLQGDKMGRNILAGERPLFPFPSPKYLTGLTKRCWQADPSQRPGFSAICRVLRYVKRFLLLNLEQGDPTPSPPVDYFDLDAGLCRRLPAWEATAVAQVPFQMFAYRVTERERTGCGGGGGLKEKSSESGSEGASVCGEESVFVGSIVPEDPFSMTVVSLKASAQLSSIDGKKLPVKKNASKRANTSSGQKQRSKGGLPQLAPCASLRMNSEAQLHPIILSPGRPRSSGHASD